MEKLEVGQTFEVVEILIDGGYRADLFKIGGHTIKFGMYTKTNGTESHRVTKGRYGQRTAFTERDNIKPIGRLKIKSLK